MGNIGDARIFLAQGPVEAESSDGMGQAEPKWTEEEVLSIHRWTPKLLSFRTTRDPVFGFSPGHYGRVGIADAAGGVEWRPLSMVSAPQEPNLEFVVVLVPQGALSERIARLRVGDKVRIEKACFGFLTLAQLAPGNDLWLLASGSGIGPFISILRDPEVWSRFEKIVLVHSVRETAELVYRTEIAQLAAGHGRPEKQLSYVPVVTRESCAGALPDRIPNLLRDGRLETRVGFGLDAARSRAMVCGNPEMTRDLRVWLGSRGFQTSRRGVPGQMAFEKYW